ncbi:APC family permease [Aciditerrimonas ferrireducens]|uniref:APC family permease n=1 Tax=Aciditerrimonas ferrireducens TaxID=667306 RepID=A0ABV6BZ35_9ACTN
MTEAAIGEGAPRNDPVNDAEGGRHRLSQVLHLTDLFPLSVSSIGPVFSVAATGGVMAADAGWWTLPAIAALALPFVIAGFVFRLLNKHFPHAGASYHWSARVMGGRVSRYQAWILILAYFTSIPPIAIPAASYTLALIAPHYHAPEVVQMALVLFWICFAAIPLLLGARPTAQITKAFFVLEMVSLVAFGVLGLVKLHQVGVPVHFGPAPIGGMLVVAVVAATVLDGWEIDSYAAEESTRPRKDPGLSGLVGAFLALGFYAILYPLMFAETPMRLLASPNDSDPLALWAHRILPGEHWAILIPILGSTAGGLWLTTYILTRALYAMGRENLIPTSFGRTNRHRAPQLATLVVLGATLVVVALETFVSSLGSFFTLVLSAAGFFLLAEFFLDCLTAVVFLTVGHRRLPDVALQPHRHRWLLAGALFSCLMMGALLVTFFFEGPKAIGGGIDQTLAVMIVLGVGFAWLTGRRRSRTVVFEGRDVEEEPEAQALSAPTT